MVEIPCRKYNALGLATIRLIADLKDKALEYMLKKDLEFMPSVYCSDYKVADIREVN